VEVIMSSPEFLNTITHVYQAARRSDDGERCMVAPSPDLRDRIKSAMTAFAAGAGLPSALSLRAAEPRALGFNDGVIIPPNEFPLGTAPSVIRAAAAQVARPLRGTVRVIIVLVDFPDKKMTQTRKHFEDLFFSLGVLPTKSVREYYREVTHGLIDIQGDVIGPLRLPQTIKTYANGAAGTGPALPNARTMARDAVIVADPKVDFTPFDNNGDGFVDAFIVIHAGPGGEVTGNSDDIWSHKWTLDGGARAVDQTKIFAYLTVPEDCKIGVCAHELGHLLFGFPDLYDTDYSSEGIGNWCLMAGGSWGGGGDTPAHPSAWCKANQGWVTVDNRKVNGTLGAPDVKTSNTVYRLWKDGTVGGEYFLLENRQKTGFDVSLPAAGLLIWHVDEAQSGNTDENHYKVALMQADGKREMEHNVNRGDPGDPYPGTGNNKTFNATSNPNSKSYTGADSCVAVTAISASGPTMTAKIQVKCAAGGHQPTAIARKIVAAVAGLPVASAREKAKSKPASRASYPKKRKPARRRR
jgi:immune inhibitor A